MDKTMETELSHETAFRNSVPRHKDVHLLHCRWYMYEHNVCSVTSEPSQISSRRVSSFKDSSLLLNNWGIYILNFVSNSKSSFSTCKAAYFLNIGFS